MGLLFFADRSLGNDVVPSALRAAGWEVITMRDRYGELTAQQLGDVDWIRDASTAGEVLLTGDKKIAQRPLEARAVIDARARVFALASNTMTGPQKAARFLRHEGSIFRRAERTDPPFVVSVAEAELRHLRLR